MDALAEIEGRAQKYTKDIDETFAVEALLNRELKGVDQFDEIASSKLPPFADEDIQASKKTIE